MADMLVSMGLDDRPVGKGFKKVRAEAESTAASIEKAFGKATAAAHRHRMAVAEVEKVYGGRLARTYERAVLTGARLDRQNTLVARSQRAIATGAGAIARNWQLVAAAGGAVAGSLGLVGRAMASYSQQFDHAATSTAALTREVERFYRVYGRGVSGLVSGSDGGLLGGITRGYDHFSTAAGAFMRFMVGADPEEAYRADAASREAERQSVTFRRENASRRAMLEAAARGTGLSADLAKARLGREDARMALGRNPDLTNEARAAAMAAIDAEFARAERAARATADLGRRVRGRELDLGLFEAAGNTDAANIARARLERDRAVLAANTNDELTPVQRREALAQAENVLRLRLQVIETEKADRAAKAQAEAEAQRRALDAERHAARIDADRLELSLRRQEAESIADAGQRRAAIENVERDRIRLDYAERRRALVERFGAQSEAVGRLDGLRARALAAVGVGPVASAIERFRSVGIGTDASVRRQSLGANADPALAEDRRQTNLLQEIRDAVRERAGVRGLLA